MGHSRLCVIQLHGGMVSVKKEGLRIPQVVASTDSLGPVRRLKSVYCKCTDNNQGQGHRERAWFSKDKI